MTTRSGLVEGCDAEVLQIPTMDSTLGFSASMRLVGRPPVGKLASLSTACTWAPAPMAKSVSVAVGESDTTHWGAEPAAPPGEALTTVRASALASSARVT